MVDENKQFAYALGEVYGLFFEKKLSELGKLQIESEQQDNKTQIIDYMYELLKLTRAGQNVEDLLLNSSKNGTFVTIQFKSGGNKKVDLTADSGLAMIIDIAKALL
ncbi:MAG: hypothetical protein IJT36_03345 [Alphaproteobacteria bacterium]|nr:hypothetical protein [Clostridia bacterium]MBQ7673544.1 hypothetical protein [Alphaproteobacteria bacterium]